MSRTLIKTVETYRVDTEEEVKEFIEELKEKAGEEGYILNTYKSSLKEKKAKGEVIDEGVEFSCTKVYGSFWEI